MKMGNKKILLGVINFIIGVIIIISSILAFLYPSYRAFGIAIISICSCGVYILEKSKYKYFWAIMAIILAIEFIFIVS